ncbi:solute carrier family 23 protein [Komagataeibacter rhaeticus]|nr:solute carrier family 23 protein [Komagataeibacter rhaeticus]
MEEWRVTAEITPHPVDEMLPAGMLFAFGLQHALVMYAGTVAVPLVFAAAMHMSAAQTILLINCGLMTSGVATIVQSVGCGNSARACPSCRGLRLPCWHPYC